MRWSARLEQAQHVACCLLAVTIPLTFIWNTLCIWAVILCWLFSGKFVSTWRHLKAQPAYWLWMGFFVLHAASYYWSSNKEQSIFDTVSKLSLFVMPIVIGAGANICAKRLEQLLGLFILTMSATGVYCVAHAAMLWRVDHDTTHFFYHDLVLGHEANAVYSGWYVFTALSALLLSEWKYVFRKWWAALKWTCAVILLIFLILLSSRLLLAVFILLTIPTYLWKLIRRTRRSWAAIITIVVLAGSVAAALALTGNPINKRYREVMHRDVQISFLPDYHDTIPRFNNGTLRLFLWRCGMDNIRERDLWLKGCGNGDEHLIQNARFAQLGLTEKRQKQYYILIHNINLHNMFMESLISLGIPGLCIFMAMMILPFFFIRKASQPRFFLVFHIVSLLFMMQESALQTQAGLVFFTFFSCLYWQDVKRRGKKGAFQPLKR